MRNTLFTRLFALMLVLCMIFMNSCSLFTNTNDKNDSTNNVVVNNNTNNNVTNDTNDGDDFTDIGGGLPEGAYVEGFVLVKYTGEDENVFAGLDIKSVEALYEGSKWYSLELNDSTKTVEMVQEFAELGIFDYVDYDYIMATDAEVEHVGVGNNPTYNHNQKKYFETHKIQQGWEYLDKEGINPGGSADVVVAIIDTGVDYNHVDLRNNIWINSAEIPDNGKDDDGNGYVDDVYGWDFVGNDKDPMDDNGHGTHVAGIVAAENNGVGGVGVAFNCKIMVIKAGNSSGYFNNSDIAEAIQYAYMNGASVINMSFGGSNISMAVEDALEEAYNSCILVAAAGNDGACNNLVCPICMNKKVSYPAALPYVIGVMSVAHDGKHISSFSNYDHNPYNTVEYEVYAVGESVYSCWPNNKYATLNGTSMAAPMVAGMAALLRSYFSDREVYSTKYIQSQIVNIGTVTPYNAILGKYDNEHSVANVYEALTKFPTPEVNLYDYYIDDSTSISAKNNGNGVINAGETVRLYISLHNRGSVASDVNVTIDTIRNGDSSLTDPYFTLVNTSIVLSDIGTYSVREATDGQYFEIVVDANCPNDYLVDFNIRFTYKNGMNDNDITVYEDDGKQIAQFNVSNGYYLPAIITEDKTFTNDRLYIVGEDLIIPKGVTVTFEEGCQIQFYDDRAYYNSPNIYVYGTLNVIGSKDNMVSIYPNSRHESCSCVIYVFDHGTVEISYADTLNLFLNEQDGVYNMLNNNKSSSIRDSHLRLSSHYIYSYKLGNLSEQSSESMSVDVIDHCYIEVFDSFETYSIAIVTNCQIFMSANNLIKVNIVNFINNVLITENYQNSYGYPVYFLCDGVVTNNKISPLTDDIRALKQITISSGSTFTNNSFDTLYQKYASDLIEGYYDASGIPTVDVYSSLADASLLWPYVVSVEMFDKNGDPITTVGREEIKVRVTFNRPMDVNAGTFITFGTIEPYADYRIDGEYVSDTVWEGTYTLKAQIENGQNFLKVNNACAAEDQTKTVFGEYQLHEFTIDTTAAMAMNLIANPLPEGIELTWAQDDYDTLMGYNIYRSESKDGNYVKINPSILLDTDSTFLDTNAEPGKTYWYTFTVVLSDFSESNPAGRVSATAVDTIFPNVYHTPVNQGYLNNNLVISCTASDNMQVASLTLYYRNVGETEWRTLNMTRVNDKFSATVFGSDLTLAGLEYYIVATDGRNVISKGDAEDPYKVVIKDASEISRIGDVDGDGVITTKDALMITNAINGDLILTDDEFRRADLNEDGELSSAEALRILQYINGKVNTLR